jgi:hypothetical protein
MSIIKVWPGQPRLTVHLNTGMILYLTTGEASPEITMIEVKRTNKRVLARLTPESDELALAEGYSRVNFISDLAAAHRLLEESNSLKLSVSVPAAVLQAGIQDAAKLLKQVRTGRLAVQEVTLD